MKSNSIKNIVLELLKTDKKTRKDDLYLYARVIEIATSNDEEHKEELEIFNNVLKTYFELGLPNTKTILRQRQLIQAKHPELTDEETAKKRNIHRKHMEQLVFDDFINDAG